MSEVQLPRPARSDKGAFSHTFTDPYGDTSSGLGVAQLAGVLRRNVWLILGAVTVSVAGTYYLLRRDVAQYQAEALIRLRDGSGLTAGVLGTGGQGTRPGANPAQIATELLVIRGRAVAADVAEREGIRLLDRVTVAPPSFVRDVKITLPADASERVTLAFGAGSFLARTRTDSARGAYGSSISLRGLSLTVPVRPPVPAAELVVVPLDDAVDWMIGHVAAKQRPGTDVIGVAVSSTERRLPVRLVNAIVESYQARSARVAREEARAKRAFVEQELLLADDAFFAAQSALIRFRADQQVYTSGEKAAAEQRAMIQGEMERNEIIDERRVFESLLTSLENTDTSGAAQTFRTIIIAPAVARNPVVNQLFSRLTNYESTRDSLLVAGRPATHESVRELAKLIDGTKTRIVEALDSQIGAIDERLSALSARRSRSAAEIRRLSPASAEEARLANNLETARLRADQFRQQKELARIAEVAALGNVEIVERATRAAKRTRNAPQMLALGLMLGLFVGCGIALLREHLNTSIHRRAEVEAVLQVPGLAVIPRLPASPRGFFSWPRAYDLPSMIRGKHRPGGKAALSPASDGAMDSIVTLTHSRDRSAEAYRALRTKLLFMREQLPLRTLVVTSATVGEGKTTTAANVAAALAQQGLRVLLVDCDLRRPRLHKLFGATRAPGLTDLLRNTASIDVAIRSTTIPGLDLLPRGAPTSQPAELLGGDWMIAALRKLAAQYDLVVIDTPPLLSASDAAGLAAKADGVLFVLRAGQTHRGAAQEAMHQLLAVGAHVIGAVLNDPDAQVEKYEAYGYGYAYTYQYGG